MITEYTEVISPRRLRAAGPLDWKYVVVDLTARDAIPTEERYEGMQVFVENDTVYILQGGITNGDWTKVTTGELAAINVSFDNSSTSIVTATDVQNAIEQLDANILGGITYLGTFDPNNPPTPAPTDGDAVNYNPGDLYVVDVPGFWNFTTGDQTPDSGTDNVANLGIGDRLFANPSIVWEVVGNAESVTSVFGRTGNVIAAVGDYEALQITYDPTGDEIISGTSVEVQSAIKELDAVVKTNQDNSPQSGSGITVTSGVVDWGGALTGPIAITGTGTDSIFFGTTGAKLGAFGFFGASAEIETTGAITLRSTSNSVIIDVPTTILGTGTSTGTTRTISANGSATDIDIRFIPKGTGILSVTGTVDYEANLAGDDDIPNKKYVDDLVATIPSTSPGGSETQVQFHDTGGIFGGDPGFIWDKNNNQMVLQGAGDNSALKPLTVLNQSGELVFQVRNDKWVGVGPVDTSGSGLFHRIYFWASAGSSNIVLHEPDVSVSTSVSQKIVLTASSTGGQITIRDENGTADIQLTTNPASTSYVNTGKSLGIGTFTPDPETIADFGVGDSTCIRIPQGTTSGRDTNIITPKVGMFRFNTDDDSFEGYTSAGWGAIGGAIDFTAVPITHTSGDLNLNFDDNQVYAVTLQGDVDNLNITATNTDGILIFIQDGTGNHNVLSWGGLKTVDGATPDLSLTGNSESFFNFLNTNGSSYLFGGGNLGAVA